MAIFDEKILEQFMPRGMGNSGVASREVQASNLPDLSAAVRASSATQANLADQRASAIASASALANRGRGGGGGGGRGGSEKPSISPFILGGTKGRPSEGGNPSVTIARPNASGTYDLQTLYGTPENQQVLKDLGLGNINFSNIAELNTYGIGGEYSKNQLAEMLSKGKPGSGQFSMQNILKNLPNSTGPVAGRRGEFPSFATPPEVLAEERAARQAEISSAEENLRVQKKIAEESKLTSDINKYRRGQVGIAPTIKTTNSPINLSGMFQSGLGGLTNSLFKKRVKK
jgi:hypothetical protein